MEAGEDIFFQWLNFSAPHEKSTFGGPAMSSHVTVDLGVNHGEDSRWITVKKPFYFHGFLFLGSFLASKMEKKSPNQQSFFHFYPENWGRWTHFWRAYFSKGLVQPPTSCSFLSTLCPPKVSHHPQSSSWYLPRSVFFFFDCGNFPPEMGDWFLPRKKPRRLQVGRVGGVPFPGKTGGCCSFISINLRGP